MTIKDLAVVGGAVDDHLLGGVAKSDVVLGQCRLGRVEAGIVTKSPRS